MKIVSIVPRLFPIPGGPEKLIFNLSKTFAMLGHEAHVITQEGEKPEFYKAFKFKVHYAPRFRHRAKYLLKHLLVIQIISKLLKIKPDVIHVHETPFLLSALIYKHLFNKKCKIVLSTHYFFIGKTSLLNKFLFTLNMHLAPNVASVGKTMQKETKLLYGKGSYLVSLGLEVNKLRKLSAKEIIKTKKKYHIPEKRDVVLFLGRIVEQKGIDLALDSIAEVVKVKKNALYVLAGGGDAGYIAYLNRKIDELNIRNNVKLIGQIPEDEITAVYSLADVFLTTTYWETMSISALEALSCGLPVVTTDVGSMRDVVLDDYNGFVIPERKPEFFAGKILQVLKRKNRFSHNARKFAEKNLDLPKVTKGYLKLYETP